MLVLNPSSKHVSLQYHVVFDNNFSLILALYTNTVPSNYTDLVTHLSESTSNSEIGSSKVQFNQQYKDLANPNLDFSVTFTIKNSKPLVIDELKHIEAVRISTSKEDANNQLL